MASPPPQCKAGLVVPALPTSTFNAVVYLFGLFYCFLGTAIIADIFMCAIERITSTTKKVKKIRTDEVGLVENGKDSEVHEEFEYIQVWNPTVANLTLMALGSSAPEILLSLIEIVGNNFKAGDLGPGTIVGSAAFNLFCISAICVLAAGSPRAKRIQAIKVFMITAGFSVFAYLWILVILVTISPNVIEVWEAALTFVFFFVLVIVAYAFDVQLWKRKKTTDPNRITLQVNSEADGESPGEVKRRTVSQEYSTELPVPDVGTVRDMTREVARVYPSLSPEDQAKILAYRINQTTTPHDRLYYRIKAIREMTSSWRESKTEQEVRDFLRETKTMSPAGRLKPRIEWSARTYGMKSGEQSVRLTIIRRGPSARPITVSYHTVNGIAKRDLHFFEKKETVRLEADEKSKNVEVHLVPDGEWKPGTVFYVHLKIKDQEEDDRTKLGSLNVARIRVCENPVTVNTHPTVEFARPNYVVAENAGWVRVFVKLIGASPGVGNTVKVNFQTEDVSAQADHDYVPFRNGELLFKGNEIEKAIDIEIIDDKLDEKDETFLVTITKVDGQEVSVSTKRRTTVTIISDDNALKNVLNVRKLMGNYLRDMKLERATWKEQIVNAVSVNGGDVHNASMGDAIRHAIAFPWKFAFAFVPPPEFFGGWPCFLVALFLIGFVTAIVGDVASIFGCMVGLEDTITAITLVALGTSLPDTFASKIAAENDRTADNAVGNVTGSNSVNVFLGLGLPWLVASVYWASKGQPFRVPAGDLAYSVSIFTALSLICLLLLFIRRGAPMFGCGELGGPKMLKWLTGVVFVLLWLVYLILSIARIKAFI